jgi:hypothetical protein
MANTSGRQSSIGNGQTLNADAALYWKALQSAVFLLVGVWVIATEGTRTYARQMYLWVNRNRPGFNPAWHPDNPRAYHLSGRAVDVGSGVGYVATAVSKAFYKLAGSYGFRATVPGEPWHFEWRLEWVATHIRQQVENPPADTPPVPRPQEDDDMLTVRDKSTGHTFLTGLNFARHLGTMTDVQLVTNVNSSLDELHNLENDQIRTHFASYGIPLEYVDAARLIKDRGGVYDLVADNARDLAAIKSKLGA